MKCQPQFHSELHLSYQQEDCPLAAYGTPLVWQQRTYALKSHRELKQYLPHYEETIMDGLGHGEFLLKQTAEACKKIRNTLSR